VGRPLRGAPRPALLPCCDCCASPFNVVVVPHNNPRVATTLLRWRIAKHAQVRNRRQAKNVPTDKSVLEAIDYQARPISTELAGGCMLESVMPAKISTLHSTIMSTKMGQPTNAPESRQPRHRSWATPPQSSAAEADKQVTNEYLLDALEASSEGDPRAASSVAEPHAPSRRDGAAPGQTPPWQEDHRPDAEAAAPKAVRAPIPRNTTEFKMFYLDEKTNIIKYAYALGINVRCRTCLLTSSALVLRECGRVVLQRRQECLPQHRHVVPPVAGPVGARR